jgi:hypothetical protein
LTNSEYHADHSRVSHSMLEVFRRSIPEYHGRFVSHTIPAPDQTPSMLIGSALHCRLLEPDQYQSRYATAPEVDRRTKDGKAQWEAFLTLNAGKDVLTAGQSEQVAAMALGVARNQLAQSALIRPGDAEHVVRWVDLGTGLACKARLDKLLTTNGIVLDLKTTADPSPEAFAKSVANYGYHCQAAWYLDAANSETGGSAADFLLIAVGSQEPFECVCYSLEADAVKLARQQNARDLAELAGRIESNNWESRWSGVQQIDLPRWAYPKN